MAKTIKFPLDMGDGIKVRTIEELRENFKLEQVICCFSTGKLLAWLKDRHYQTEYEKVSKLREDDENLLQELSEIFQVNLDNCNVNVQEIINRQKLKDEIKQYLDDDNDILNHLDLVAVNQAQFNQCLEKNYPVIYLYGERFQLPGNIENVQIKGINEPTLEIVGNEWMDFKVSNVEIFQCRVVDGRKLIETKKDQDQSRNQAPIAVAKSPEVSNKKVASKGLFKSHIEPDTSDKKATSKGIFASRIESNTSDTKAASKGFFAPHIESGADNKEVASKGRTDVVELIKSIVYGYSDDMRANIEDEEWKEV